MKSVFKKIQLENALNMATIQSKTEYLFLEKCYYSIVGYQRFMLWRVIHAIGIGILKICYAMAEFVFLHFSIEALVINFYKKMDCYQELFHYYESVLGTETV